MRSNLAVGLKGMKVNGLHGEGRSYMHNVLYNLMHTLCKSNKLASWECGSDFNALLELVARVRRMKWKKPLGH